MYNLLRPKAIHLLLFGVFVAPVLYYLITEALFSLFGMAQFYELFIYSSMLLLATLIVDLAFKTKVVKYGIVAIVLLIGIGMVSIPVSENKEVKTEKLGLELAQKIKEYKTLHGHYPDNLNDGFFKDVPKKTAFGQPFQYTKHYSDKNGEYFELKYFGLAGMDGYLYSLKDEWIYVD